MIRQRRRPPLLLFAAVGITLGLSASVLATAPRVTGYTPAAGSPAAPASPPIAITFSRTMRPQSVESRFHLTPARPGAFQWEGRTMTFLPSQPWPEATQVEVELEAGAQSIRGLPTLRVTRWSFTVGAARLAYLWPAGGTADLYLWSASQEEPERLTHAPGGIVDFDLVPGAAGLVFAAKTEDGTEIRVLDLDDRGEAILHRCPAPSSCRSPTVSPDGRLLAFVQEDLQPAGETIRRVWVRPLDGGQPYLVSSDDHPTSDPQWSSHSWLALYDHALLAYAIYDQVTPQAARLALLVPNAVAEAPAWSPDGEHLVFAEVTLLPPASPPVAGEDPSPRLISHLQRIATGDGAKLDLSGDETVLVDDAGPAYSPDGGWIAFSRRSLEPDSWTLGRQLWRMRPDGTDPTRLTDSPTLNHGGLAWSPDGTRLAYMLFDEVNLGDPAEIWWRWADGRAGGLVAEGGYEPQWIP